MKDSENYPCNRSKNCVSECLGLSEVGDRIAPMVKSVTGKEPLQCCTLKSNGKVIKVGDSVLMRAQHRNQPPYVARVEKIESGPRKNMKVRVRWYYRPEDSKGGRRQFHGAKELFLSDHYDTQSVDTIEDTCVVHSFNNYSKLESVTSKDYFCRFEYMATTGAFNPQRVPVYCTCEMPYNPDDLMVQCEACKQWFHPECIDVTIEEAKAMRDFLCFECTENNNNNPGISVNDSVPAKRRKTKRQRR